jgi:glucose 1-dehydrogenase
LSGRLAGRVALVTGAATGIGRALAGGLAAEGAVVHANDLEPPYSTLEGLPAACRGLALGYDISSTARIEEMFGRLDRLDVLVNCAGVTGWIDLAALPLLRAGGGSIVNISSVVAVRGLTGLSAYAASKGGIDSLTVQLACELASHDIRVNGLAPGATNVERNLRDDPNYAKAWAPLIPLGRIAEPDEMVGPAVFLASDDSAHMTGQTIYVDGGWTSVGAFPESYVESAVDQPGHDRLAER